MKRPSEFDKSSFSANGLMTVNYLFTALVSTTRASRGRRD